jgi:carotenoid 1,2-hydratase
MTERDRHAVERSATRFVVGPSSLEWRDGVLEISLDEITAPIPRAVRGRIRVHPLSNPQFTAQLDAAGRHWWTPIAPRSRVELDLEQPHLRWSGQGYLDSNRGSVPLESDFTSWHWSRAQCAEGDTTVFYDVHRRDGSPLGLALHFDPDGRVEHVAAPPERRLPTSGWGIARTARPRDGSMRNLHTLEDTPFYARSLFSDGISRPAHVVHESLSLERFESTWVQTLLPFRMPRRRGGPRA